MTARGDGFFLTAAEIYRQLTEGPGARTLSEEQRQTYSEQSAEEDRAALIRSLANVIQSGWQGQASAGAYGAAMPLAERAFENSAKLDRSQDLLSRQIDSFHTAVNSVVPVGDPPEMSIDEKFPFDVDHEKAVREYQDSAQTNIAAFRAYDDASHYNETNLPQDYSDDIRAGGNVSVKGSTDTIEAGEPGPRSGGPRSGGPGDSAGPPGSSGFFGGSPGGPGAGGDAAGPGGAQTSPNEFRPVPSSSSQGLPFTYPAAGSPSPVSGGFVGGYPGGSGGGFGPGAGAGALAAEDAVARRAAQAAAAAGGRAGGAGPMGTPVGAGRGKDDEDTEHQRKVLIESDAEETFGSDELTAPQVIGDDEYEED